MIVRVAYQGEPGGFSEEACRRFLPDLQPVARASFAGVANAVASLETARGMLPLENSSVGPVPGVHDLIAQCRLSILSRHTLAVRLHLLANREASIEDIRVVASHPMALGQCRRWIEEAELRAERAANTASAALALAQFENYSRAVIASERAASIYGLTIIRRDVQDKANNETVFGVIALKAAR